MRAVVYEAYQAVPHLREVPDPVAPEGGVVVEVAATGVCRSDWHAWMGHDPVRLPHVPGHELAGTVVEVGAGVGRWRIGDRVTAPFVCGCGRCEVCAAGDPQVCPDQTQPGFTGPGSWAQRVVLHAADLNLVRLPDRLGFVEAAALGCRFATAYRGLVAHGDVRPGQWVVVVGCGGVGLSAIAIAAALGARVVAVDVSTAALAAARAAGAREVVDASRRDDVAGAVVELTGGGAHVGIDALGSAATAVTSVRSLRRRGRHLQVGLLLGDQATPPLPMDRVIAWELSIHGTHGMAARDYPAMLDLVGSGRIDLASLVGRVLPLADAPAAMVALGAPAVTPGLTLLEPGR